MAGVRRFSLEAVGRKLEELFYLFVFAYLALVLLVGVSEKGYAFVTDRMEVSRLNREIAARKANVEALDRHISEAQTPQYVERRAREELGMARPGEILLKKVSPDSDRAQRNEQTSSTANSPARSSAFLEAWKALKKLLGR